MSKLNKPLHTLDVFTTGEAAEACMVSQQTIIRCFDSGQLKGFKVPGSRFRRIPRDELYKFMKDNNIPTDLLDPPKAAIVATVRVEVEEALGELGSIEYLSPFDLATRIATGKLRGTVIADEEAAPVRTILDEIELRRLNLAVIGIVAEPSQWVGKKLNTISGSNTPDNIARGIAALISEQSED